MRLGRGIRIGIAAVLAAGMPLGAMGSAEAKDKRELTVMTQNLYLGSSLNPALQATTPPQFVGAVAQIYGTALFVTDFESRSEAIAETIQEERPDLIGLQEVSRWTAFRTTGGALPGVDFLDVLQQDLEDLGLDYEVASVSENAKIGPAPLAFPSLGCVNPTLPDCAVMLEDRDVILVNADTPELEWSNPQDGSFDAQQTFAVPGSSQAYSFDRGWASIDGTFEGKEFRFVNTHLEVEDFAAKQEAQAREFLAGPANTEGAVIATGDFNSAADGSTTTSYADLTESWFKDAWWTNPGDPGYTCCQVSALNNPESRLRSRIDLILTHGPARTLSAEVVGEEPFQATAPLWPSDHAGVVATLRLH